MARKFLAIMLFAALLLIVSSVTTKVTAHGNGSSSEKSIPFQGELLPAHEKTIKPNLSPPISIKANLSPPERLSVKPNLAKTTPESAVSCHVIGGKMVCPRVFACHNPNLNLATQTYRSVENARQHGFLTMGNYKLGVCPSGNTQAVQEKTPSSLGTKTPFAPEG